ncbi:gamma-glutamyltransferase 1 [Phyllosticta capitalensis]|uniref:Glutathione hydrolase n=1 Tax=Phyllosticta capitalensis TaxID=121624 RepID=A0ABR1YC37_9PEZI
MPALGGLVTSLLQSQVALGLPHSVSVEDGHTGAVAAESRECSTIGIDLLKAGGTAADALVGTVLCVGVIGMYHSGIAGGGFMTVRTPNGTYEFIDFRETAPAASTQDMYNNNTELSELGGLASGVPGELRGLERLHTRFGKLSWEDVVTPAVQLARYGFRVNEDLVKAMNSAASDGDFFVTDPNWALDFAPNGTRLGLNDTITRKRYADTLEVIATEGVDAFYTGAIANATITAVQEAGGIMTLEDLANYTVGVPDPLSINYRGYKVTSGPAPCSGAVALSVLKIVEGYEDFGKDVNLTTHRLDEAIRWGYAERTELGDPDFVDGMKEYQEQMLSENATAEIRRKISDTTTHPVAYYDPDGIESLETPGTSHVVTADKSGLAISLTTTINLYFGSRVLVPETGVIMNNEMNDFSVPNATNSFGYIASEANYIRPGKRPLSSITPIIIDYPNGTLYISVGAAGGSRIITSTIQNVFHMLDQDMTAPEALKQSRLHDQLVPNTVSFEYSYDNRTTAYMKSLGHNVTWVAEGQSTAQALRRLSNGTFEAAGEPRQKNSGGYVI